MTSASPTCLMARTTSTMSWLWHQRLSHLKFDTINELAKNDLIIGLPNFKYYKEHLCPSCEQGKSKKSPHKPKPVLNSKQMLHLLHMDLCGHMRFENEAPEEIKTFLKKIQVLLQALVIIVQTDNGIEFWNQDLKEYFDDVGISYPTSSVENPQQNGVVEQRNRTLVEATRMLLIFSCAPLFLWAEAIATAKQGISFLHVFGALCYPKNDCEDIGKLGTEDAPRTDHVSPVTQNLQTPNASTTTANSAPTPANSSSQATTTSITSHDVDELQPQPQHVQQQDYQPQILFVAVAENVQNLMFDV
uniref:Integrase catalytic domain-containing protein n=1 Tax=Tanacetum cinerariifolium TaxID=118510 RepID=A0A6L2LG37_TANCI|nr:hypothetical protein [Tanacetum cinerariifolium]